MVELTISYKAARSEDMASAAPKLEDMTTVSATEAKTSFGVVMDKVITGGSVAITKHDQIRAVIVPVEQYKALLAGQRDPLAELEGEFESLVERMQTRKAHAAGRALFDATSARLGRAAVAARRKRG